MKHLNFLLLPLLAACSSAPEAIVVSKPSFDVPALLFSHSGSLKSKLGKPISEDHLTPLQIKVGAQVDLEFVRDSTLILVSCDPKNRGLVNDIFIFFPSAVSDITPLLAAGGLQEDRLRYSITPVKQIKNPELYSGIIVKGNDQVTQ